MRTSGSRMRQKLTHAKPKYSAAYVNPPTISTRSPRETQPRSYIFDETRTQCVACTSLVEDEFHIDVSRRTRCQRRLDSSLELLLRLAQDTAGRAVAFQAPSLGAPANSPIALHDLHSAQAQKPPQVSVDSANRGVAESASHTYKVSAFNRTRASAHDLAVVDDTEPDAGAQSEHDEILGAAGLANPLLRQDGGIGVIAQANLTAAIFPSVFRKYPKSPHFTLSRRTGTPSLSASNCCSGAERHVAKLAAPSTVPFSLITPGQPTPIAARSFTLRSNWDRCQRQRCTEQESGMGTYTAKQLLHQRDSERDDVTGLAGIRAQLLLFSGKHSPLHVDHADLDARSADVDADVQHTSGVRHDPSKGVASSVPRRSEMCVKEVSLRRGSNRSVLQSSCGSRSQRT